LLEISKIFVLAVSDAGARTSWIFLPYSKDKLVKERKLGLWNNLPPTIYIVKKTTAY
jgi:hypothetical protein